MKGIVHGLSRDRQRVAVITDYGYTVFEIIDGEASLGDEIIGNLDDDGDQLLANRTTGQKMHVYTEAIQADLANAQSLLGNR